MADFCKQCTEVLFGDVENGDAIVDIHGECQLCKLNITTKTHELIVKHLV